MDVPSSQGSLSLHRLDKSGPLPAYSVHLAAIRSIAAFLVLAGHARLLFFGSYRVTAQASKAAVDAGQALGLGHHARIVLFMLSGFLVGSSAYRSIRAGRWSWRKYLVRRMTRLWIVLLPALVLGGCLDTIGIQLFSHTHSIYSAPAGQTMVNPDFASTLTTKVLAANALFLQTIQAPTLGTNIPLWSLANEFWYYMAFPPLLLLVIDKRSNLDRALYLVLTVAILTFVGADIAILFLVWLMGFGVSLIPLRPSPKHQGTFAVASLVQFVLVNAMIRPHPVQGRVSDFLLSISFAVLLYSLVQLRQPISSMLYQRLSIGFSKFTYTLYLTHLPFLVLLTAIFIRPWHPWPKDTRHLLAAFLLVCCAYSYSWLLYLTFERNTEPLRHWVFDRLNRGKARIQIVFGEV